MTAEPVSGGPRVVVVGGGGAGAAVVRTLLKHDEDLAITLLTAEPHAPYDRTQLSKADLLLADPPAAGCHPTPKPTLPDGADGDPRLTVRTATPVAAVDRMAREVVTAAGDRVGYDHLVLATGSGPRRPDLPGIDLPFVHMLRELEGWPALRDAVRGSGPLVVIGGGLIGLEVAAAARRADRPVTVVEVADRLMPRVLPAPLAELLAAEHAARGVRLELGQAPVAVVASADGRGGQVHLADGRALPAAAVLLAVGAVPRLDLPAQAGLEVDDGVVVDPQMRTADPAVLAAGDIVRVRDDAGRLTPRTEAWTPAVASGQRAALTVLGRPGTDLEVPWMWSDQDDLRLQTAGAAIADLPLVRRGSLEDPAGVAWFGVVDGRVRGVAGMSRGEGIGRTVRAGQLLIARGVEVDPEELADPTTDLRRLAAAGGR